HPSSLSVLWLLGRDNVRSPDFRDCLEVRIEPPLQHAIEAVEVYVDDRGDVEWGCGKTERLGGLEVQDHLKFCRKLLTIPGWHEWPTTLDRAASRCVSFCTGSFSSPPISTPMRRTRSRCCAGAASGHAAAPPSAAMNSRRLMTFASAHSSSLVDR